MSQVAIFTVPTLPADVTAWKLLSNLTIFFSIPLIFF